jgi:hypothetical protein
MNVARECGTPRSYIRHFRHFSTQSEPYHHARLLAAAAIHSGDWLHALPISACGLRLNDEAVRVAVGLRLGTDICQPHHAWWMYEFHMLYPANAMQVEFNVTITSTTWSGGPCRELVSLQLKNRMD